MKKLGFAGWYVLGAASVIGLLAACGGKVTWVEDGATQSGGAGGTGSTSKNATSSKSSTVQQGTSVVATSVQNTAVQGTSVVASSGNVMPGCDTGEFGNPGDDVCNNCVNCSLASICANPYNDFLDSQDAQDFVDCLDQCGGPMCQQKCQNDHPMGSQIYFQLVDCVLCQSCANNCGEDSGCFGPPPPNGSSSGQGPG